MPENQWTSLPKIELHTHLDCALSYQVVKKLGGPITLQEYKDRFQAPPLCKDLASFLSCIDTSLDLMQTKVALQLAAEDFSDQLLRDNVKYAEVRFAPLLHTRRGITSEAVVEAVVQGLSKSTMPIGLILCTLRHFDTKKGLETVNLAKRYLGKGVVGLDLAGDERNFPLDAHIPVFRDARDRGVPYTMHAGEALGAKSVGETIEKLSPLRIGHGVNSINDPEVLELILERGVHLEICPSVNLQVGLFPSAKAHPIDQLRRAGISIGINTDARTTTGVTLAGEYQLLAETFGWEEKQFRQANLNALAASFASEATKKTVLALL